MEDEIKTKRRRPEGTGVVRGAGDGTKDDLFIVLDGSDITLMRQAGQRVYAHARRVRAKIGVDKTRKTGRAFFDFLLFFFQNFSRQ